MRARIMVRVYDLTNCSSPPEFDSDSVMDATGDVGPSNVLSTQAMLTIGASSWYIAETKFGW